jgi:hypothetical protein
MSGERHEAPRSPAPAAFGAAPRVVRLVGVDDRGVVRVLVEGHGEADARLLHTMPRAALQRAAVGRELLAVFEGDDPARPIVVGMLEDPVADLVAEEPAATRVLRAEESITLVCGEASLTLHADGRVVTRGVNVVSVASEQQRIQGAVVRIN